MAHDCVLLMVERWMGTSASGRKDPICRLCWMPCSLSEILASNHGFSGMLVLSTELL